MSPHETLRTLVDDLTKMQPLALVPADETDKEMFHHYGTWTCLFCGYEQRAEVNHLDLLQPPEEFSHAEDCVWNRAQELVG